MSFAVKARTLAALGLLNVVRVGLYRLGLRSGLSRVQRLSAPRPVGPFFIRTQPRAGLPAPSRAWQSETIYFDSRSFPLSTATPDWMHNPYTGKCVGNADRPWWKIPDFDPSVGDIKIIWELSRFGWVVSAAERAATGDEGGWQQLEGWLSDWCEKNPPYLGPNWKCGQEASIRVMHLVMAAIITGNAKKPTAGFAHLIETHLKRIEPTIQYAIGQDNNHGTSEAAALFIGGSLLAKAGFRSGEHHATLGRKLIENRVNHLVSPDGSFSQYSLTYHRLFVDSLVMAEVWRRQAGLPRFSDRTQQRLAEAARWLFSMIDPLSGDGPNLGANDGARLLPLTDTGYRDFRPSVQLSMALFCGERAYSEAGNWNDPFAWLDLPLPTGQALSPGSVQFDNGGYAILKTEKARAFFRYPRFRFRPAQSDALHVDLWIEQLNLLRDAGTFSYNTDAQTLDKFAGVAGHNTISFDGKDQMPRLGRFLFGEWLQPEDVSFNADKNEVAAGYTDWRGNRHHRSLCLGHSKLTITDKVSGPFQSAVLRWRLAPGDWRVEGNQITDGQHRLTIRSSMSLGRIRIMKGEESLLYLERQPVPVVECDIASAGTITSEFVWS
ncbi:heparinase II/III family protein [Rhizobium helianthi]|uniref:Heparinase II/III family protein n=1 Tax=Rhizobium helianthi TaxID=1132695 RepID=A0ABW4M7R0_9HYPH